MKVARLQHSIWIHNQLATANSKKKAKKCRCLFLCRENKLCFFWTKCIYSGRSNIPLWCVLLRNKTFSDFYAFNTVVPDVSLVGNKTQSGSGPQGLDLPTPSTNKTRMQSQLSSSRPGMTPFINWFESSDNWLVKLVQQQKKPVTWPFVELFRHAWTTTKGHHELRDRYGGVLVSCLLQLHSLSTKKAPF